MSQVKGALDRIGFKAVQDIRKNLTSANKVASGKLIRSVSHRVREITGGFLFEITADSHWKFVDKGVNGTQVGHGSPFSFSGQPPTNPIRKWLRQKGMDERLAFVIARSIGRRGLKPTGAFSDVTDKLEPTLELQEIYLQFIENEINKDFQKLK